MTTTTFFPGSVPSSNKTTVRKPKAVTQAAFTAPRAAARVVGAYPWMTQQMLSGLSLRARRLLRADY